MTTRRALGAGPAAPAAGIRATQADLLHTLPGTRLPDLAELRTRGVAGNPPPATPAPRRPLGAGHTDTSAHDTHRPLPDRDARRRLLP
ncbi:hypothetical protein GPA10_39260 [Streptomyces sp. p1417]|uniref:Uncharacterized protein n=1 Tax=Streptomyces typhae TaxID=2681492 RepID=A0A6L6X9R9_9ACTN|nr:hypothetical protein [Streptomyces typhae]MVO90632.1 hypothetical protein [Streptomyces typhae]